VQRHRGEVELHLPRLVVQFLDRLDRLGRQLGVGRGVLGEFVGAVVGLPDQRVGAVLERALQGPVGRDLRGLRASVSDGRPEAQPLVTVAFRRASRSAPYASEYVGRVDMEVQVPDSAEG
jgi:hypothetical protein